MSHPATNVTGMVDALNYDNVRYEDVLQKCDNHNLPFRIICTSLSDVMHVPNDISAPSFNAHLFLTYSQCTVHATEIIQSSLPHRKHHHAPILSQW